MLGWVVLWSVLLCGLGDVLEEAGNACTWSKRREEPNIVEITVEAGERVDTALRETAEAVGIGDEGYELLVQGARLRHPHADPEAEAPYRLALQLQLPWVAACQRFEVSVRGGQDRTYELVYDAHDNATALAAATCRGLGAAPEAACVESLRAGVVEAMDARTAATAGGSLLETLSCPAARARREAAQHACAGPWTPRLSEVRPTEARCVTTLSVDGSSRAALETTTPTCLLTDLVVRDGVFYRVVGAEQTDEDDDEAPTAFELGTRGAETAALRLETLTVREVATASRASPAGAVLEMDQSLTYALLARWDPFDKGEGHGHALHDAALPVAWALASLDELGLLAGGLQLVFLDNFLAVRADAWLKWIAPNRPPVYAHELASFLCPAHHVCRLPRAVVGLEQRSYFALDLDKTAHPDPAVLAAFGRAHAVFANFCAGSRVAADARRRRPNGTTSVLILNRLHSRVLTNVDDIRRVLVEEGSNDPPWTVDVRALDFDEPEDQLRAVAAADLVVAVEGGAVDLLLLVPPSTAIVLVGRNPALPWPEGCSGCGPVEQFTHGRFLDAAASWIASARVACCGPGIVTYTPDPYQILAAARLALARHRRISE